MKFVHKKYSIFLFLVVLIFTSCQTNKNLAQKTKPVYITNSKKINILDPSYMKGEVDKVILFSGSFGEQSFTTYAYFLANSQGISISLFNDLGSDMGFMNYDGQSVIFESPYITANLQGEYIIADIQFVYYDFDANLENLKKSGLNFTTETDSTGNEIRKVLNGNKVIEEIFYAEDSVKIVNYLRGYEYNLVMAEE